VTFTPFRSFHLIGAPLFGHTGAAAGCCAS
jgi:hypothetical protein